MRTSTDVEIFGERVKLWERSTKDVIALSNCSKANAFDKSTEGILFERSIILVDSLKENIRILKWYQISKQLRYRWKFRTKYILKHLGYRLELLQYTQLVLKNEGIEPELLTAEEKKTSMQDPTPS